jgi:hypothetical protein
VNNYLDEEPLRCRGKGVMASKDKNAGPQLGHSSEFRFPDNVDCIRFFVDWESTKTFGNVLDLSLVAYLYDDRVRKL